MKLVGDSRFFEFLLDRYALSPSIALCRVPELELLSEIKLVDPVLDHCCGDGFIAETAFPGRTLAAGLDFDPGRLAAARAKGIYTRLENADASKRTPFSDGSFATIFNNSGIEHILDLSGALAEIRRLLLPGGTVYFNVL